MFKYLRLHVSTSYFKTDIVLFDAFDYCRLIVKSISEILPTSLAFALCIVHHQPGDFQYKGPVRLRPSAKENKLVVFFNWPIIVCVLLECLFLSVAMDCNLVPMDYNLVPMDCDLVPMDCSCNCAFSPKLAGLQNTLPKNRPQYL